MVCIVHQNRSLIDHLDFVEAVGMGLGCLAEHILLDTKQHCWDKVWMPKSQVLVDHHPCNAAMGRDMQDMQSTDHPNSCRKDFGLVFQTRQFWMVWKCHLLLHKSQDSKKQIGS
mmetsp:Transcript_2624/g.2826  ORF Transcript_2624/g.2826 Transcript_2624/m.2826 type:complete len:114 (-) Transcript_2624:524-865(-)